MKLTIKNPIQSKTCSLVAISIALTTIVASKADADHVRVFNQKVSGVPGANPVAISDNALSSEFAARLVDQGSDLGGL